MENLNLHSPEEAERRLVNSIVMQMKVQEAF